MADLPSASSDQPVVARPVAWHESPQAPLGLPSPAPAWPDLSGLTRREAAYDLSLVMLVALGPMVLSVVAGLLVGGPRELPPMGAVLVQKWLDLLVIVGLMAYLVYRNRTPAAALGLSLDRPLSQIAWGAGTLLGAYLAFIPTVILVMMVVMLFPGTASDLQHRVEFMEHVTSPSFGETALLMVAVAAGEEVLFRGLMIPLLARIGLGLGWAVVASSAIFAVLHLAQGWLVLAQIFFVGAAFGVFFVASRSLLAVILAHFLFNMIQTQLARVALEWTKDFDFSTVS